MRTISSPVGSLLSCDSSSSSLVESAPKLMSFASAPSFGATATNTGPPAAPRTRYTSRRSVASSGTSHGASNVKSATVGGGSMVPGGASGTGAATPSRKRNTGAHTSERCSGISESASSSSACSSASLATGTIGAFPGRPSLLATSCGVFGVLIPLFSASCARASSAAWTFVASVATVLRSVDSAVTHKSLRRARVAESIARSASSVASGDGMSHS
mmetsp:Transcript_4952/g.15643  ORF Transcript_4952/g.15643 Transcript_4952/m.15643 type:complete len:216 (+) Transcript_4952:253-900(+)